MKQFILAGCLAIACCAATAQKTEVIRVPAGSDLGAAISEYGLYRLPLFTKGMVYFTDGSVGKDRLNYNMLTGRMQYLNVKGDTMDITDPATIARVELGSTVFHYADKRWMEEIAAGAAARLLLETNVGIRFEKKGAFGTTDPSGTIASYNTFISGPGNGDASYRLQISEDAVVKKQSRFYLLQTDGSSVLANKKGFLQVYPKKAALLNDYLGRVKTDFGKKEDLVQLLLVAEGKQ